MIRYELIICWSHEDEVFIAEVPILPGCMATGSTYKEPAIPCSKKQRGGRQSDAASHLSFRRNSP